MDYAVTMVVEGAGVSMEQLDYLTLQSNWVETSYREVAEHGAKAHEDEEVQDVATEAPQKKEELTKESGKMMLEGQHCSPSC